MAQNDKVGEKTIAHPLVFHQAKSTVPVGARYLRTTTSYAARGVKGPLRWLQHENPPRIARRQEQVLYGSAPLITSSGAQENNETIP